MLENTANGGVYCQIEGKQQYICRIGDPAAEQKYQQVLEDFIERVQGFPDNAGDLCIRFLEGEETTPEGVGLVSMMYQPCLIRRLDSQMVHEIASWLKNQGRSLEGINQAIRDIKDMFEWGRVYAGVPRRVNEEISAAQEYGSLSDIKDLLPTIDQIRTLAAMCRAPAGDMLLWQWYTGASCDDTINMMWSHISTSPDEWTFLPSGKRRTMRSMPKPVILQPEAVQILKRNTRNVTTGGCVFFVEKKGRAKTSNPIGPLTEVGYRNHVIRGCAMSGVVFHPMLLRKWKYVYHVYKGSPKGGWGDKSDATGKNDRPG
jgi:hypothetical protein